MANEGISKECVDQVELGAQTSIERAIKEVNPRHPALSRVHGKLLSDAKTEAVISKYDRQHHRHNRS